MARLRYNLVHVLLDDALDDTETAITFQQALQEGGVDIPDVADPDVLALRIDDEILWLTAYVEGALTGTVERGAEDTVADAHDAAAPVHHVATKLDGLGPVDTLPTTGLAPLVYDPESGEWSVGAFMQGVADQNATISGGEGSGGDPGDPALVSAEAPSGGAGGAVVITGGDGNATAEGNGGGLTLTGGEAVGAGSGGQVNFNGGDAVDGSGGNVQFRGGDTSGTGGAGEVALQGGAGATAGGVTLTGGSGVDFGGQVSLLAGDASDPAGTGGDVVIRPGAGDTEGVVKFFTGAAGLGASARPTIVPADATAQQLCEVLIALGLVVEGP